MVDHINAPPFSWEMGSLPHECVGAAGEEDEGGSLVSSSLSTSDVGGDPVDDCAHREVGLADALRQALAPPGAMLSWMFCSIEHL